MTARCSWMVFCWSWMMRSFSTISVRWFSCSFAISFWWIFCILSICFCIFWSLCWSAPCSPFLIALRCGWPFTFPSIFLTAFAFLSFISFEIFEIFSFLGWNVASEISSGSGSLIWWPSSIPSISESSSMEPGPVTAEVVSIVEEVSIDDCSERPGGSTAIPVMPGRQSSSSSTGRGCSS